MQTWLLQLRPVLWLIAQSKKYTFLGFAGISLYDIIRTFRSEVKQDQLLMRAGSMSFNFMMALFPSIIFLFTLLPYIPIDNLDDRILDFLLLPKNATNFINQTIHDLVRIKRGGLLSTGFLLAIFFASNGIMSMQRAFDRSATNRHFVARSPVQKRLVAVALFCVLAVLFLLALTFIVGGAIFIKYLSHSQWISWASYVLVVVLRWTAVVVLFYAVISIIYRYVPSVEQRFPFFSGGANVAILLILITSIGFSYFVNNFGAYNKVYGTVGTFVVMMLWFNFNARVLLVGFEINVAIQQILHRRKQHLSEMG